MHVVLFFLSFASMFSGLGDSEMKLIKTFIFFFFVRKISPELTAANPPRFAEEDWLWANIRAHLPLLYMWDAYHSMACQAVPRVHRGSEPANPGPLRSGPCELNRCATRPAPRLPHLTLQRNNLILWSNYKSWYVLYIYTFYFKIIFFLNMQ